MNTPTPRFEQPTPLIPFSPANRKALADLLRANPGQWLLIGSRGSGHSAGQDAYELRNGHRTWRMFGTGYEAESRTLLGEHRVYARYTR